MYPSLSGLWVVYFPFSWIPFKLRFCIILLPYVGISLVQFWHHFHSSKVAKWESKIDKSPIFGPKWTYFIPFQLVFEPPKNMNPVGCTASRVNCGSATGLHTRGVLFFFFFPLLFFFKIPTRERNFVLGHFFQAFFHLIINLQESFHLFIFFLVISSMVGEIPKPYPQSAMAFSSYFLILLIFLFPFLSLYGLFGEWIAWVGCFYGFMPCTCFKPFWI